jgi:acyl carrier protein
VNPNASNLLFTGGRLDSLDAVEIIMYVEMDYGINFAEVNFDLTLLDSIAAIADPIDRHAVDSRRARLASDPVVTRMMT